MSKSVKIITLGCSKNTVDSEKLARQLDNSGYSIDLTSRESNADIVIVNTCGFINDAKEESINTILELIEARERGDIGKLYVMGCLSERYRDQLKHDIPEVDQYFGVNRPEEILDYLKSGYKNSLDPERLLSGPDHYAYLKVSEGCNRNCAFCAIPGIRGRYQSRPVKDIIEEAAFLVNRGVKEIILIAQDLSYYGKDLHRKPSLASLCESILQETEVKWLRLHYLYPGGVSNELLELIRLESRICNYIDIPIQHISDRVLSSMKRNHTGQDTRKQLQYIRDNIPGAAVRTTLITGYPGETDDDFMNLLDYVRDYRFDRLGVFTYSHEEDTYAHRNLSDDIPSKIKKERADIIMAAQQEISLERNRNLVGSIMRIIIDREEQDLYIGRTEHDSPEIDQEVLLSKKNNILERGEFYDVVITGASEFDLEAKLL